MPKDYLPDREKDLLVWFETFASVASTHVQELGLTPAQVTQIGLNHSTVAADIASVDAMKKALKGKVGQKKQTIRAAETSTREIVNQIQANLNVSVNLKDQLGINPHDTPHTNTPPAPPTDLKVFPDINGTNTLKWQRGDNKTGTRFVIEAMLGGSNTYTYIASTSKTRFEHTGQALGVLVWYRVRAERSDMASDWCTPEAAYGGKSGSGKNLSVAA